MELYVFNMGSIKIMKVFVVAITLIVSYSSAAVTKNEMKDYLSSTVSSVSPESEKFVSLQQSGDFNKAHGLLCERIQKGLTVDYMKNMNDLAAGMVEKPQSPVLDASNIILTSEFPLGIAQLTYISRGKKDKAIRYLVSVDIESNCIWQTQSQMCSRSTW